MNSFSIMIVGVWIAAALGSIFTKDTDPFNAAMIFSIFAGLGYLVYKG